MTVLYPAVSHTFIQREILGLRERGIGVKTFSLNPIIDEMLLTDVDHREAEQTIAIKAIAKRTLLTTIGRQVLKHPGAVLRTLRVATRGTGIDLATTAKRVFQVGEALVMYDACAPVGITHIHAHFGQAPTNVAWFTTEFANLVDDENWTFSSTIHGPQDCLDEPAPQLRRKVAAASAVVSVSDYTAAQLLRQIDPSEWDKTQVIRCGIDIGADTSVREPHAGLPSLLMVARISPEKGHTVAVEALAELRARGTEARLRLVGPGDTDELMAIAHGFGVADLIDIVGALEPDDVRREMETSQVFLLPSFAEGLPIVIMEAMAAGCPVVSSGISGIPELVEHDVSGLLVPPARADLLANAIERMLNDNDLREQCALAGRQRVSELHDGDHQIDALAKLFFDLGVVPN